jgi:uncharacterized protein YdaL
MDSTIVKKTSKTLTIQVTIPVDGKDMLTKEEAIQTVVENFAYRFFHTAVHALTKSSFVRSKLFEPYFLKFQSLISNIVKNTLFILLSADQIFSSFVLSFYL